MRKVEADGQRNSSTSRSITCLPYFNGRHDVDDEQTRERGFWHEYEVAR